MKVKEFSYRHAKEILEHKKYNHIYEGLISVCKKCPIPLYEGKSKNQKHLNVIQQIINTYFKLAFAKKGWELEPLATPENNEDSLRSDFRNIYTLDSGEQIGIQIEVEMGNSASSYRNYFKFQMSYSYALTDICVLIVPCFSLAKRVDSGVASFEKTCREIPSAKLSITVPILVIGLDDSDEEEWNVKDLGIPLEILKGSKDKYKAEHEKLIKNYIESIEN